MLNNGNGVGNNVNSSVRAKYGRFAWTAIPTAESVNEFRFGWFKDKQFDYPNDALGIPGIGFLGISITGQTNLGTATDYPRTNPSENRYQFADSYTWTKGKHTVKVGFEFMRTEDYTNLLFNRTGTYLFPSFTALAQDLTGNAAGNKDWLTFTQAIGNPIVDLFIKDYSFFVQDQFKVTPRLTLNLGMRYDYSALPQPTRDQSGLSGHRQNPDLQQGICAAHRVRLFARSFQQDGAPRRLRHLLWTLSRRPDQHLLPGQRPLPEIDHAEFRHRQR